MANDKKGILNRVSTLSVGDNSVDIYNDWAQQYDEHLVQEFGYVSPKLASQAFYHYLPDTGAKVIDYGCGTGLVGEAMQSLGYRYIDGMDISQGMLDQAGKKAVYRKLLIGDLTDQLKLPDEVYDGALCVGSMGAGHVGAQHVSEMLRPIKAGGLFVIYMNAAYYEPEGFAKVFKQFEDDGLWTIQHQERSNYMSELDRPGYLIVGCKAAKI